MSRFSFFARVSISERALDKWLKSLVPSAAAFSDWDAAPDLVASGDGQDGMTVQQYLDELSDSSEMFCYEYDDGSFYIAEADGVTSPQEAVKRFAAFRGASAFVDTGDRSYLYSFPRESGGDPYGLIEIDSSGSRFIPHDTTSPDAMYFISDAEDFIESLVDEDDD